MIEVGDKFESEEADDTYEIVGTGLHPSKRRWYRYLSLKYPSEGALVMEEDLQLRILNGSLKELSSSTIEIQNRLDSIE